MQTLAVGVSLMQTRALLRQHRKQSPGILGAKVGGKSRCCKKEKQTGEAEVGMRDREREYELIWIKWMRIRSIYLELV